MKQVARGVAGGGGGGGLRLPTEDEVEVVEILLSLPKLCKKSELIGRYSFNWGQKKKRSVLDNKSEEAAADKSPSTPLCFLPAAGTGSDGCKPPSPPAVKKTLKRKATDDLLEIYNKMQQENEILMEKLKVMKTRHQELTSENLELKARGQQINYPINMEDLHIWNSTMKQQHCHQQITMFAPPPTPHYCHQQLVVDPNNGKLVAVSCSSNGVGVGGGRFGLFNKMDPRVKIRGEGYDFMAASQPFDQSKYMVMDNDLRLRTATAAAARKRRILKMKENKNSLLAMKLSRGCR